MKILYIAASAPYDKVGHAGGQTLNYYIKGIAKKENIDVTLVAYCASKDICKIDVERNNIHFKPVIKNDGIKDFLGNVLSIPSKIDPFHKYGNIMTRYASKLLINELKKMKKEGYEPDVIIMEWTQIVIQAKEIKSIFKSSKLVASEHDVTYLGIQRVAQEKKAFGKVYQNIRAKNIKRRELCALNLCDVIFTHNYKDDELLKKDGISAERRRILVPFYHQSILNRNKKNNDIIFYGNMKRKENYLAAFWFIDNVMPFINDLDVRFVIMGGGPSKELMNKECDRVHITGFVEDIDPIFSEALCFVAPLKLGAGIKVKVIEALYTGIPVLTNEIGIEGIPAKNCVDYFQCETPQEYANAIKQLYDSLQESDLSYGKKIISNSFSLTDSFENYCNTICQIK